MGKILVLSAVTDDCYTKNSEYILKTYLADVQAGLDKYAGLIGADKRAYLLPEGSDTFGIEGDIYYGISNLTGDNPYSVAQNMEGKLPRPMIQDGYTAMFKGDEVSVLTPEAARWIAVGAEVKTITVNVKGNSEVKEAKIGTPLSEVVDASGAKAVLVGGLKGEFVKPESLASLKVGADFNSSSLTVVGADECMVDFITKHMGNAWVNSCGKCVLCREGTLQYKTICEDIIAGKAKMSDIDLIKDVGGLIRIGAYCPYGQNMPRPLLSAVELFAGEFEDHIKRKKCPANICYKKAAPYVILPDLCTGCTDCVDECDESAILSKKGFIHIIDQDMCEQCGACVDSCDEGAIVQVEGKMPRLPKKLVRVGKF